MWTPASQLGLTTRTNPQDNHRLQYQSRAKRRMAAPPPPTPPPQPPPPPTHPRSTRRRLDASPRSEPAQNLLRTPAQNMPIGPVGERPKPWPMRSSSDSRRWVGLVGVG